MQQQQRFLLFLGLMILIGALWIGGKMLFFPTPPEPEPEKPAQFGVWDARKLPEWAYGKPVTFGVWDANRLAQWAFPAEKDKEGTRLTLGSTEAASDYQLRVILDSRGAGV